MKFQTKIVILYTIFAVLVTFVIGGLYYGLSVQRYQEEAYGNLKSLSDMELQQFDNMIERMEMVSGYLLSDKDVLNALKTLTMSSGDDSGAAVYFSEACDTIRLRLNTNYFMKNFYRVVVFNKKGNVVASNNYSDRAVNPNVGYEVLPWIERVTGKNGKNIILGLHEDDWGQKSRSQVISLVKEIQGMDMGFIEVQQDLLTLTRLLQLKDTGVEFWLVKDDGSLIYSNADGRNAAFYLRAGKEGSIRACTAPDHKKILLSRRHSERTDVSLLAVRYVDISRTVMLEVLPVMLMLLTGFILLSFGYIFLTSRYLAKPIRQLQGFMDETKLDNMDAEIAETISNDEIASLYGSYKSVLNRLDELMVKEKRMSLLQLQAQFDLLQAQVNPHFIYNVLNVISSRGILSDDEVICDICDDLAGMLRYSTNTKKKYATVRQEAEHLELYLRLLKYRYEHKLSYHVSIDTAVMGKTLPKIVLQQIVENSVTHGYENSNSVIEIVVNGWQDNAGWYLRVYDNGSGIPPARLQEIQKSFCRVRQKLTEERGNVELEIGGMGLVNTYARLFLLYNKSLRFTISSDGKGTDIVIGVQETRTEVEKNVPGDRGG